MNTVTVEEYNKVISELQNCRDELCLRCGNYHEAHNGACDGCRYKDMSKWEKK